MGILIINIQSFAMPGSAYLNPASYGDLTGLNKWVWIISHVLADTKMMAIFSTLFGAGLALIIDRSIAKGNSPGGLHFKRMFWLLLFGLVHAHLIWHGDILVTYALCGMFAYLFRKKAPRSLITWGLFLISIHTFIYVFFGFSLSVIPEEQIAEMSSDWAPGQESLQEEIALVTGSLAEQVGYNSTTALMMETFVFFILMLWRALGLMLIGMALYRLGILSAQKSKAFYRKGWMMGWLVGFPLVILGVYLNFKNDWSYEYSMFFGSQLNYWGSLGVSFGYVCIIMLLVKSGKLKWLQDRLAAAGQMAFTNYITQSIICVFIFWGIGFGLFGQVERTTQILVVFAIWILQLAWSKPWLEKYRFGPLEWLWRSLSYGEKQKM